MLKVPLLSFSNHVQGIQLEEERGAFCTKAGPRKGEEKDLKSLQRMFSVYLIFFKNLFIREMFQFYPVFFSRFVLEFNSVCP